MSWKTFDPALIVDSKGHPTVIAGTGKVKVPKIGQVFGVGANPQCGDTVPTYGAEVTWDSTQADSPTGGWTTRPVYTGDQSIVKCKDLVVGIPHDAVICGIRYFASNSKGRDYRERSGLRNTAQAVKHDWARKEKTRTRVRGPLREFSVRYKNWRRSYNRYFGYEVEFQLRHLYDATSSLSSLNVTVYHDEASEELAESVLALLEEHEVGVRVALVQKDNSFLDNISKPQAPIEVRYAGGDEELAGQALKRFLMAEMNREDIGHLELAEGATPGSVSIFVFSL